MSFLKFYNNEEIDNDYIPELYEIVFTDHLVEVNKNIFITNTDAGRIKRARQDVRTRPPTVVDAGGGYDRLEYNFKAFPSREFKRHQGYVEHKGTDVRELFCDCKDFFYRLYAPMVKKGLATWNLSPKYRTKLVKTHNRQWTTITNPDGQIFVCKHLYALISEYVDEEITAIPVKLKKLEKKPEKPEPKKPIKKPPSVKDRQADIDRRRKEKAQQELKRKADLEFKRKEKEEPPEKHIGKQDKEIKKSVNTAIKEPPDDEEDEEDKK